MWCLSGVIMMMIMMVVAMKMMMIMMMMVVVKEERNGFLQCFQQLRSYHDEVETRNKDEIHFSSWIVPMGLSVAEGAIDSPPQCPTFI